MNDMMSKDISELIKVPVPFLLSEIKLSELVNIVNKNGYNILHQAVSLSDFDKVKELINHSFPIDLISLNNKVTIDTSIEVHISSAIIAFNSNGYTPFHLSIFLYNLYSKYKGKQEFFIHQKAEEQLKIILYFLEHSKNNFGLEDGKGFSIMDYCFLLENVNLINKFFELNQSFSGLRRVKANIALKICQSEHIEKLNNMQKINSLVFQSLNKSIQKTILEQKIIIKETILSKI